MPKIIKINEEKISIGMPDGGIKEVRPEDLNFVPKIGDEVEIFESETEIIVNKKEKIKTESEKTLDKTNIILNPNSEYQQKNYTNNKKSVEKTIYCLLALFFGGIGLHKFYAGKTGSGLLYFFFSWTFIPLILSFIDFVIGLSMKADRDGNILI